MRKFEFKTTTTMKEYNAKKWWIYPDVIRPITISAENLNAALHKYAEYCYNTAYIEVSKNALRTKSPMYVDLKTGESKQVGYVITGKSDFQRDDYSWSTQYIDLWVSITEVTDIDFEDEEAENYD